MENPKKSLLLVSECVYKGKKKHPVPTHRSWWTRMNQEDAIFTISQFTVLTIWQLPMEKINGNFVPTVVFKGQPSTFHTFIVGVIFVIVSSVCTALCRQRNPKLASYYRMLAVIASVATMGILWWAMMFTWFTWVVSVA